MKAVAAWVMNKKPELSAKAAAEKAEAEKAAAAAKVVILREYQTLCVCVSTLETDFLGLQEASVAVCANSIQDQASLVFSRADWLPNSESDKQDQIGRK
jgi:hypothetical protein